MPVPDALETVTVRGDWISPLGGGVLTGWAQLAAVATVRSPAGDVVLTTVPIRHDLVSGAAEWTEVVLSDSPGLAAPIVYRLRVRGADEVYQQDRFVQLFSSAAVGGVIRLDDVASAEPAPVLATYLLASEMGHPGGAAGPLGSDGLIPTGQLPAAGGSQPADADLTAIAALAPVNGDLIQRFGGVWSNRTPAQVKASLTLVVADTAGLQAALDALTTASAAASAAAASAASAAAGAQASADAKIATAMVDVKGDLIVATAPDAVTRLAAGADGHLLRADSAQATGLRWAALAIADVAALQAALDGKEVTGTAATAIATHLAAVDPHGQYLTAAEGSAAYQPLDGDLSAIAALAPANGALLQRVAGVWNSQSTAQVKASLGLVIADTAGLQAALDLKAPLASPTFTGTVVAPRVVTVPVVLADAATIATDAALGTRFRVTLGGNRTLGAPTNLADGQMITWEFIQDATGNRTIALDAVFALGTDLTAVTLSTAANKHDLLGAYYNATLARLLVIALARGY